MMKPSQHTSGHCDVLLVNPPWITKDGNIWHGIKGAMPPLGLLSVAAYAEREGLDVQVLDLHVERKSIEGFREALRDRTPRMVGVSMMTATATAANRVACVVKEELPDCTVVVGGVHAEAMPTECLKNAAIDLVVRGDGEKTFSRIALGDPIESIRGVSFRRGTQAVHNPPAEQILDLDALPMPAYHLVPMHSYYPTMGAYRRLPAMNMLMTRGCPGKCTFCNSAETVLRTRTADLVVNEIEHLRRAYGIRQIQFYDDTFTIMKQNVMRFCALMKERRLGVSWTAFVRSDCFSTEMARAMAEAGCHQILFGVESGDETILKNIRKPIDMERTSEAVRTAQKAGLQVRASFMFGNPGETEATMQRTIDYALQLNPDFAIFNITTPYPGTQMFTWAKENGYLRTEDWNDFELSGPVLLLPTVDEAQIQEAYNRAYRLFYLRPGTFARQLKRVRNIRHLLDGVQGVFYILFRLRLGSRSGERREWVDSVKEDFWTVPLVDPILGEKLYLTSEVAGLSLTQQTTPATVTEPARSLPVLTPA